ncbi:MULTISPECIES: hypothetical protein [Geobacillus]|nr:MULTISPECIES: hypothetical protein [Geobacillus]MEC5186730.1 hypothetical protein [Geobacillus thermodenitrificans]MED3905017.1 hypothetical protein [Geobacillus thermodenitrificans]
MMTWPQWSWLSERFSDFQDNRCVGVSAGTVMANDPTPAKMTG